MVFPTILLHPPLMAHPRNIASGIVIPPLWAAYLASTLRAHGFPTGVVDAVGLGINQKWRHASGFFRGLTLEQILPLLPENIGVLGLSCPFSNAWPMVRDLAWGIREHFPHVLMVMGGEHVTAMPVRTLQEGPADLVVMGEGELTMVEVLRLWKESRHSSKGDAPCSWEGLTGVAWKDNHGKVHWEGPRPRNLQLDSLPPPDWEGIPLASYFKLRSGHGASVDAYMPVLATRGCPHACTFCASPNTWSSVWSARSPQAVVDEMQGYLNDYGVRDFHFTDLSLTLKKEWTRQFCQELIRRNLSITWQLPTGTRSETIDEETAKWMARAGCTHVSFAVESGDVDMLRRVKKNLNLDRQLQSARALMKEGVRLFGFFIIGFPDETWSSLGRTYQSLLKTAVAGFDEAHISVFAPVPGSADFQALEREGMIVDDAFLVDVFHWATLGSQRSFCRFSSVSLRALSLFFFASFFFVSWTLRPWRPLKELGNLLLTGVTQAKMARVIRSYLDIKNLKTMTTSLKPFVRATPGV